MDVPFGDLADFIPNHDDRRIALARDSLASAGGFCILVLAAFKFSLLDERVFPLPGLQYKQRNVPVAGCLRL